jgi:hypothetical protein
MPVKLHKIRETDASRGCWLESCRGWRAMSALVFVAHEYGMTLTFDDLDILAAYEAGQEEITLDGQVYIVPELVSGQGELADQAEDWLNDHVASDGYSFGWSDGEFFYQPSDWWEDN